MNPEVERIWTKLETHQNKVPSSEVNRRERRLVVGDFAAAVTEIELTSPARLKAWVGWSITPSQHYDRTVPLRHNTTRHFDNLGGGRWMEVHTEAIETDEEIVDWMLRELQDWVATNGKRAQSEDDI